MSKYEYPRIPLPEISKILAQFQIADVPVEILARPNAELVSDLYSRILNYLDLLPEEDHEQLEFSVLEKLENPDFHVDSVRVIKLYNRIKMVVATVECPKSFSLKDLLKPDADCTELFLSAMLNFCLHRETRMNTITEIVDEVNILEQQQRDMESKISKLNSEILEFNEGRERERPLVQEVEARVTELRQNITAFNNDQVSLRTHFKKLKDKASEMDEKISSAEFTLVQNVQENANLLSKIVQSPDKLQRALEEKKSAHKDAKNAERSAMQTFHDKTAILESYSKVYKKMSKHFAQMQAIQEQVNSAKSIEKDLKALKAKLSDEGVLAKTLQAKLVERHAKAEQLEELRKQLEKERHHKQEEANKELSNVKLDVESKRRELELRQKGVEVVVTEVEAINSKTDSVRKSEEIKLKQLRDKYEEIVNEFHQYADSIEALLPADIEGIKV